MRASNSKSRFHVRIREHANNWISDMPKTWAKTRVRNSRRRETRYWEKLERMMENGREC